MTHPARSLLTSLALAAVAFLTPSNSAAGADPPAGPAVWLYRFPGHPNAEVIAALKQREVRRVFLSIRTEWLTVHADKLREFLREAHRAGIAVDAMTLQDPSFVRTEKQAQAAREINLVLNFCRANPDAAFDGIHLDAEPHVDFRGGENRTAEDWAFNEGLMKQYLALVTRVSVQVKAGGLPLKAGRPFQLSAAVAWWYNERAKDGRLPSGAAAALGKHLDFIVPMVYDGIGGSAEDVIRRVSDELETTPTMIGLARKEFNSSAAFQQTIRALDEKYRANPRYRGISIFEYDRWTQVSRPR